MSPSPAPMTDGRRILITAVVCLSTVMQALDSTIANVALPFMQGTLSASQDQISWVITSYVVATAIMTTVSAYLADRFGRKAVIVYSVVAFTFASVLCGAATSLPQMVLFRVLQGFAAACVTPLSNALIVTLWPPEKRGVAMSFWGMGVMLAPVLGPTLGGYLTDVLNWRWVFLVNVPIGIVCVTGLIFLLPDSERLPDRRLNIQGFAFLSIALGALQLMLDRGQTLDWFDSREIQIEAIVAALCFYLFLMDEATAKQPFLEPGVFRDRSFLSGCSLLLMTCTMLMSTMVLWPTMLQTIMGYPVMEAGKLMMPRGLGAMASMGIVGHLVQPIGSRKLIFIGIILSVISFILSSQLTVDTGPTHLMLLGCLQGVGTGFVFVPMNTLTYETLDRKYLNHAAVFYSLGRNMGTSVGTSIVVTMLSHLTVMNHAALTESITPFSAGAQRLAESAPSLMNNASATLAMVEGEITRQAAMAGYCNDYLIMGYALASISLLLLISRPGRKPSAPVAKADIPAVHEV